MAAAKWLAGAGGALVCAALGVLVWELLPGGRLRRGGRPELAVFFDGAPSCGLPEAASCPRGPDARCPDHGLAAVEGALDGAEATLDLCLYTLSERRLVAAVRRAVRRGVRVRLLVDKDMAHNGGSAAFLMVDEGVSVKAKPSTALMHHKFAVVDARLRPLLVVGSMNWTRQAVYSNWENVILTPSRALVEAFGAEFERLWGLFPRLRQEL